MKQATRLGGNLEKALSGKFSVKPVEIIREAWQLNKRTFGTLLGAVVIAFAILLSVTMIGVILFIGAENVVPEDPRMQMLTALVQVLVYPPLVGALYLMGIRNSLGMQNQVRDVLSLFNRPVTLIAVAVAMFLLQQLSMLLLGSVSLLAAAVTNIAINLFFVLALPLVAAYRLSAIKALQTSAITVSKDFFNFLALFAALTVLVFISALPLGLGLIWTLPLYFNAVGILYRDVFGLEADTGNDDNANTTDEENSSDTWTA